ncbi:MAG: NUDIX domain-containing protein, partial [Phycisphaerales bacterium]
MRLPDGDVVEREIVGHDDAVAVVAVTDDGDVLLVRQHRQAVGGEVTELPAGTLDVAGEDVLSAAARELAEETGLSAARLEVLTSFWTSVGWTDERVHVVLARDLRPTSADGFVAEHEEAHLTVERLPFDEA